MDSGEILLDFLKHLKVPRGGQTIIYFLLFRSLASLNLEFRVRKARRYYYPLLLELANEAFF